MIHLIDQKWQLRFYIVKKNNQIYYVIQNNAVVSNFLFIKEFWKKISSTTDLNINICILKWFLKNHVTLKTGVMAAKDSFKNK